MPTSADFRLENATDSDKADLDAALNYLSQSPEGAEMIREAIENGVGINFIHDGNDKFDSDNNTINWDPRSGLEATMNGQVSGVQSAALGLAHEMAHANDPNAWWEKDVATNDSYANLAEAHAIKDVEDKIASELGEPTRDGHYGRTMDRMNNSTDHLVQNGTVGDYYAWDPSTQEMYIDYSAAPMLAGDPYPPDWDYGGYPGDYDWGGDSGYAYYCRTAPKAVDTSVHRTGKPAVGSGSAGGNTTRPAGLTSPNSVQHLIQAMSSFSNEPFAVLDRPRAIDPEALGLFGKAARFEHLASAEA
jgi:hypothetical protein